MLACAVSMWCSKENPFKCRFSSLKVKRVKLLEWYFNYHHILCNSIQFYSHPCAFGCNSCQHIFFSSCFYSLLLSLVLFRPLIFDNSTELYNYEVLLSLRGVFSILSWGVGTAALLNIQREFIYFQWNTIYLRFSKMITIDWDNDRSMENWFSHIFSI